MPDAEAAALIIAVNVADQRLTVTPPLAAAPQARYSYELFHGGSGVACWAIAFAVWLSATHVKPDRLFGEYRVQIEAMRTLGSDAPD